MSQPHVTLETRPIEIVGPQRIIVAGGAEHLIDTIYLRDGFRSQNFARHIDVVRLQAGLSATSGGIIRAYRSVVADGLPNFGMLYGPNTNLSHVSILPMIEA